MKGDMIATLTRIAGKFPDRVARAMYPEANIEITEMKRRTPVDTTKDAPHPGQLRASGTVLPPERHGRTIIVRMYFGGPASAYAIFVHEILDNIHPVGQAKYMESVLNESRPYMAGRIARRIHFDHGDERVD